ncbi:MAG TPA: hypothetical protein VHE12_06380 [bacterium]|nr:hypothetical protein [bacterium]
MKSCIRLFICCLALGMGAIQAHAQTRSIISNLANPAIGFNALFLVQAAPDLDQPYGPQFQESEISLISTVDPYWTLTANLVFAPDEVTPEEVFATNNEIDNIQLKVGKFKVAFGKHGRLHTHAYPFIQAPVIMENSIGEEGFNGTGIEASWLSPLPWFCELTLGGYQGGGTEGLNFASTAHENIPWLAHLKNQWDLGEDLTMELGESSLMGLGDDGLHHAAFGVDLTFREIPMRQSNQRGWILAGEYIRRDSFGDGIYNQETDGWNAFLQYRWSQSWWTGIRVEEAYHSLTETLVDGAGDPLPGHVQKGSANITWTPSEFTAIRAEYSIAKADADDASGTAWDHRVMVQFNYTIGFHPPHSY